ncbi:MAG: hypothetical protein HZB16_06050 [Armatimonadetes bacterium]|nr:hypothetical protein [Armatimonadota bacterium]
MSVSITGSSGTPIQMTRLNEGSQGTPAKLPGMPDMTLDQQVEAAVMSKVASASRQAEQSVLRLLDVHA